MKVILVAGAMGVIGQALLRRYADDSSDRVIALSRRPLGSMTAAQSLRLDLLSRDDCADKLAQMADVTHIVFAAWIPAATRAAEVAPNLSMLRNLFEDAATRFPRLEHVTLLQGAKAYGSHLGPFRTPARESDGRHMPPNFYYDQEDFLRALQQGKAWTWTILRPTFVYGYALGNPMNLLTVIAVYATLCRHLRLPLRFPGSEAAYRVLTQAVDADLVARAIIWAGESATSRNEVFNITNGDLFRWANLWPRLAECFGIAPGEPQRIPLIEFMSGKAGLWDAIVEEHGLVPTPYDDMTSWAFGETSLNREYDHILDTTKIRRAGFGDFEDTQTMFERQIRFLREQRIIA